MTIAAMVKQRLQSLGYTPGEADAAAIEYSINRAENSLKANTNLSELPEGLCYVWAEMAAGLFLKDKKAMGALDELYDFSAPVKSQSMGDTSVTFADTATAESRFNTMIERMISPPAGELAAYRRLAW